MVEVKDILESLGWDKAPETREEFEQRLKSDFIARSVAHTDPEIQEKAASKMGARIGSIETLFKQGAKELGIEKIEGEKAEDIIKNGLTLFHTKYEEVKNADKKTKSQREEELLGDMNKWKSQYESQKELADKANQLYEKEKTDRANFEKNWIIKQKFEDQVEKKAPWTDDYRNDEVRQKGFSAILNERVKWDLDEAGELIGLKPDGKPYTNPAGNKILSPLEIVVEIGNPAKVIANNNLNNPNRSQQIPKQNGQEQGGNVQHGYKKKS